MTAKTKTVKRDENSGPKLFWERVGRGFYAHVGRLTLEVRRLPRSVIHPSSPPWRIECVFGDRFASSVEFELLEHAQVFAEKTAERYAREAHKLLVRR